jgi:hypothetical protein
MNPRVITTVKLFGVAAVIATLVMIFPKALAFVELGAQELRYFWWAVLLVALAVWLIWGLGKKK